MKLLKLEIFPHGQLGWDCEPLEFGNHVTHIFGPNGCGKTPIVQSIAFCLGYRTEFRNDIYDHCSHACLTIEHNSSVISITRQYSRDLDIEVAIGDSLKERYFSEREFTSFLLATLGLECSSLVSNKGERVEAYISTLLPLVYTDQDNGYSRIYSPPSTSFIKDQFSEMVRLAFGLQSRNSFDVKKGRIEAKKTLDYLDKIVHEKSEALRIAKDQRDSELVTSDELTNEIQLLEDKLTRLSEHGAGRDDSAQALDNIISGHSLRIAELEKDISEIGKRRKSIFTMIDEINSEINALSLNEASRRVFLSFSEICSNTQCQLFSSSSDSYAKNLLYLKDQIKDLQKDDATYGLSEHRIRQEISTFQDAIQRTTEERNSLVNQSDISTIVSATSVIKNQIFALQSKLDEAERLEHLEKEYVDILNKRESALAKYESYTQSASTNPEIVKLRADLRRAFLRWLDELHTTNVSHDVTFRNDFEPLLGTEKISQLKGSTKVRTVLAYHAALIELLADNDSPLKFLILDTPKQHEIHNDDLDRYFRALKEVCKSHELQIIFSTTEYQYFGDHDDLSWTPRYPGEEQLMFLRESKYNT